jgi:hypothetical protein
MDDLDMGMGGIGKGGKDNFPGFAPMKKKWFWFDKNKIIKILSLSLISNQYNIFIQYYRYSY